MLSKLAVRRLTKLADYMDSLPKQASQHFYMGSWFGHSGTHKHKLSARLSSKDLNYCGTTACALGWGATMPFFKKLGLSVDTAKCELRLRGESSDAPMIIAGRVFNIDTTAAHRLFSGVLAIRPKISTPKQWAKHCRKFLRDNA